MRKLYTAVSIAAAFLFTSWAKADGPYVYEGNVTTAEDTSITIPVSGTDGGGNPVATWAIVVPPNNGTASLTAGGFLYTPNANWNGQDFFVFKGVDGSGNDLAPANVTITVSAVNDAPELPAAVALTTPEDMLLRVNLLDYVADVDSTNITYTVDAASVTNGTFLASTNANEYGVFFYTPNPDASGFEDSFTFNVSDGQSPATNACRIAIQVIPVMDAPVSSDRILFIEKQAGVTNGTVQITATDVDPGHTNLTFALVTVSSPAGIPSVNASGLFTFTVTDPSATLDGAPFVVTVGDGDVLVDPALQQTNITVLVYYRGKNGPILTDINPDKDPAAIFEGESVVLSLTGTDHATNNIAGAVLTQWGMKQVAWYKDAETNPVQVTTSGTLEAITSAYTFDTSSATMTNRFGRRDGTFTMTAVASDLFGNETAYTWTVTVKPTKEYQSVTFPALPDVKVGERFWVTANASSGLAVRFDSQNGHVAHIASNEFEAVSSGTAFIDAWVPGDNQYLASDVVTRSFNVMIPIEGRPVTISGDALGAALGNVVTVTPAKAAYKAGERVTLKAVAKSGYTFLRWGIFSPDPMNQAATLTYTVPFNATATIEAMAIFKLTSEVAEPTIQAPVAPDALVGLPYNLPVPVQSECLPKLTATGLPAGLAVSGTSIAGVPTRSGSFTVSLTASNAGGKSQTVSFSLQVEALPAWAQGTFNGWTDAQIQEDWIFGGRTEHGVVSMTVSPAGFVAGKFELRGKSYAFNAKNFSGVERDGGGVILSLQIADAFFMDGKSRFDMDIRISPEGVVAGATARDADPWDTRWMELFAYRNAWSDANVVAAQTIKPYQGYYTVALPSMNDDAGSAYLTLTVDAKGGVKAAGKLADGTVRSFSTVLIPDGTGRYYAVLSTAPATYQGGFLFGFVEFIAATAEDGTPVIGQTVVKVPGDADAGVLEWINLDPKATTAYGAGFDRALTVSGGWYDKLATLQSYYSSLTVGQVDEVAELVYTVKGAAPDTFTAQAAFWNPGGLSLAVAGSKVSAAKADAPKKLADGTWDYAVDSNKDNVLNSSGLVIGFTQATGVFRGTFNVYYDYATKEDPVSGARTMAHTAKKVAYEGVVLPVRENPLDGIEGRGFFLMKDKSSYENALGTPMPYTFNWSYEFTLTR